MSTGKEGIPDSGKSRKISAYLAIFPWGLHKFYLGDYLKGLLHLFTFGGFLIVTWYQSYQYFTMDDEDFHRRVLDKSESETTSSSTDSPTSSSTDSDSGSNSDNGGYFRDLPDSGLSHERHDFDIDKILGKDAKYLDDDEEVKYVVEGKTLTIEGGVDKEVTSSSIGKRLRTVVTDKRILLIIPKRIKGTNTKTIMYDDIVGVDLATGYVVRKMRIQTPGRTYDIQILHEEVTEEAIDYIREMKQKAGGESRDVTAPEPDPTEQLQNLRELHEAGAINDAEFEEKKEVLLEKI